MILHLLDIEPAKQALEGVRMELVDSAYPLVAGAKRSWGVGMYEPWTSAQQGWWVASPGG